MSRNMVDQNGRFLEQSKLKNSVNCWKPEMVISSQGIWKRIQGSETNLVAC